MSRRLRRRLDFAAGVLSVIAVVMIFFIPPFLWAFYYDTACGLVWCGGIVVAYIAASLWEYKPERKTQRRRVRREYEEE